MRFTASWICWSNSEYSRNYVNRKLEGNTKLYAENFIKNIRPLRISDPSRGKRACKSLDNLFDDRLFLSVGQLVLETCCNKFI